MTHPATHCDTCGAVAADLPGAGPVIRHLSSCRAEYDRIVQAALDALYVYREVTWMLGQSSVYAAEALEAADRLADAIPPLAGYALRLARITEI